MVQPRANLWLDDLVAYVPGKAGSANANPAKLSSNESPLGPSPKAVAAAQAAMTAMHRYPDGSQIQLREALAARYGLEPERIVCGTGSDEILQLIPSAYCAPGDEVLHMQFGFMVYPIAAKRAGARPVAVPDTDYKADVDALLAAVSAKTRVVYLANPNNPTGTYIPWSEVERLHQGLPESVLLVLDSAYAEYVNAPDYQDGIALARTASNVLTTRTFSKIHGLAAERVGWGYGPQAVVDVINKIRGPFNVTSAGQAAALAALEDSAWEAAAKAHNDHWLPWLSSELAKLGLHVVPSVANFVLVRLDSVEVAARANVALADNGYMVRYLPKLGLGDCLRISVGNEAENRGVVAALARILGQA
jgi:histidinol-phosphate aminotransferase